MILDAADTVLGIFGFNRTVYEISIGIVEEKSGMRN